METRLGEARSWRARDVALKKQAWVCVDRYQDGAGDANRCIGLGAREMVDSVANQSALVTRRGQSALQPVVTVGEYRTCIARCPHC